jgi:hypothetical protein
LELNGALPNPRAGVELVRLGALHDELLRRASVNPREPQPAPTKVSPVLETVTMVLELAGEPMRAREIHAAACELAGEPLLRSSVKGTLASYASGSDPRFRRIRRGMYQTVEAGRGSTAKIAGSEIARLQSRIHSDELGEVAERSGSSADTSGRD